MADAWSPEEIMTEQQAVLLIEEQFPKLIPARVELLGEGFDNTVFTVNDDYVFRFPRRSMAVELLRAERRLLPRIAPLLPIAIPEPLFAGSPSGGFPWLFLGYKKVNGQTPSNLTREERLQSVEPLARFLRELHQFPVEQAGLLGVPKDELGRLNLVKRKPKLLANLEKLHKLGLYSKLANIVQFAEGLPEDGSDSTEAALVHGDLHIRNILVDSKGAISGVIDWGDVHIGHPALDLSLVYSFFPSEGRERFFELYGEVSERWKQLAQFKAIYTLVLLLLYGHDLQDENIIRDCQASLSGILEES
ncbi:phosphotransferase [Heyndrickxia acidicola]|uniref:Phosphotransferase n=1 Tax=Heyndrickxia acidicola TaxID=209389 RepID=A0ABU6MJW4_9BACI|nr:phosphotransferase [Heyndrickxia acidicola]MED1203340.1 phosphotransferase [Heyndrickxia acidicola]